MSLSECIQSHTYRQYKAWLDWLDEQWNIPSKQDHYLAKIVHTTKQVQTKKKLDENDSMIKFKTRTSEKRSKEEISTRSRSKWLGWLGGNRGK